MRAPCRVYLKKNGDPKIAVVCRRVPFHVRASHRGASCAAV
jgi:hypothetical protein